MHEYDTVLKSLLQDPRNSVLAQIAGAPMGRLLNVELPEVQQTRVDLLFETSEELPRLIVVELQSANDSLLPLRMAEYSLRVYRIYKRFPEQSVLYVGNQQMNMPSALIGPNHLCRYKMIDIRLLDEEMLLNSPRAGDNIIAILARHKDRRETIRRIAAVKEGGMQAIVKATMGRWFTEGFRNSSPNVVAQVEQSFLNVSVEGYTGCCAAIRDTDQREAISRISAPHADDRRYARPSHTARHGPVYSRRHPRRALC